MAIWHIRVAQTTFILVSGFKAGFGCQRLTDIDIRWVGNSDIQLKNCRLSPPYWRLAILRCGAATQRGKKDIYGGYQSVRYGCHNQDQEIYINGEQRVLRSFL
jgi:hypothetical protein